MPLTKGIGTILMQDNHPICFINKVFDPRHQALLVYEKKLIAIVHVVQTWNAYLAHRPFIIKNDQKSLKFLMEQKVTTHFQHMWLSKLMEDSLLKFSTSKEGEFCCWCSFQGSLVLSFSTSLCLNHTRASIIISNCFGNMIHI